MTFPWPPRILHGKKPKKNQLFLAQQLRGIWPYSWHIHIDDGNLVRRICGVRGCDVNSLNYCAITCLQGRSQNKLVNRAFYFVSLRADAAARTAL